MVKANYKRGYGEYHAFDLLLTFGLDFASESEGSALTFDDTRSEGLQIHVTTGQRSSKMLRRNGVQPAPESPRRLCNLQLDNRKRILGVSVGTKEQIRAIDVPPVCKVTYQRIAIACPSLGPIDPPVSIPCKQPVGAGYGVRVVSRAFDKRREVRLQLRLGEALCPAEHGVEDELVPHAVHVCHGTVEGDGEEIAAGGLLRGVHGLCDVANEVHDPLERLLAVDIWAGSSVQLAHTGVEDAGLIGDLLDDAAALLTVAIVVQIACARRLQE